MKLIKIVTAGKVAMALASFTLIVALFSFARPNLASSRRKVTGRELFEGIFFLKGEIARQLPALEPLNKYSTNQMNSSIQTATNERQVEFISHLLQKNNMFFTQFQTEMTSGDAFRISAMLEKAVVLSKEVLNEMPQLRSSTVKNSKGLDNGMALDTYCEVVVYNPCYLVVLSSITDEDQKNDLREPFTRELLVKQIIEHFDSN